MRDDCGYAWSSACGVPGGKRRRGAANQCRNSFIASFADASGPPQRTPDLAAQRPRYGWGAKDPLLKWARRRLLAEHGRALVRPNHGGD
jgi:hypothetical protein